MRQPAAAPSKADISKAVETLRAWQLHYYQLLWFHEPKLTAPGRGSRPFNVDLNLDHLGCLSLNVPAAPEYGFLILQSGLDDEAYDAKLLERCGLIQSAIKDNRRKPHSQACCGLAETRFCVCVYSCSCVLHGTTCIGSHD